MIMQHCHDGIEKSCKLAFFHERHNRASKQCHVQSNKPAITQCMSTSPIAVAGVSALKIQELSSNYLVRLQHCFLNFSHSTRNYIMSLAAFFISAALLGNTYETPASDTDKATIAAIEATCFDYIDGQLEGNPARVARSLHPDLAKRSVIGDTPDERLGLRRMSKEELVALTKNGALKTSPEQWDRSCKVLDVKDTAASVRLETPWFVDYFHMGRFGDRWIIVNALWYSKPKRTQ
jgi:hypothetical protein